MRLLNYLIKVPFYIALLVILYLNISLYSTQSYNEDRGYDEDVYAQLQHLKYELHENAAGEKMQQIFPEGFVFLNALYGLTWCELISDNTDKDIKDEAVQEIDWALEQLNSENAKQLFKHDLLLKNGVFYRGWTNYLLAKRLIIAPFTNAQKQLYLKNYEEIANAFDTNTSPYLESYYMASWPADNVVAIASLSLRDKVLYESTPTKDIIKPWITKVEANLDQHGRIPHSVNWKTGESASESRGNSMSLILCFLNDIDSNFANKQFVKYKESFLDFRLGLPGIREHRKGKGGNGDIDSGPVIWGIGGAASIVGQKTMATFKEWDTYHGLRNSIESFGAAYTVNGKKKYVLGQLPMADAFTAWSNVSAKESEIKSGNWRWKFQLISLGLSALLILLIRKKYFG